MITATAYLEHAQEMNAIARKTLQLETKNATALAAKISIGLSLQAAELAAKGVLRSFGHSVEEIRDQHRNHRVRPIIKRNNKHRNSFFIIVDLVIFHQPWIANLLAIGGNLQRA